MKRLIRRALMGAALVAMTLFEGRSTYAEEQGVPAAVPVEEAKSIGTQAGETARDMKGQFEAASKRLQESAQAFTQWAQEEWRKFNESLNQPAKT